jgi:flagellar hook-length control protein FliK
VHELSVQLHPAELGTVQVVATLTGDRLDVTVLCGSDAAHAAVTASIPALHERLGELGRVDVASAFGTAPDTGTPDRQATGGNRSHHTAQPSFTEPRDDRAGQHPARAQARVPDRISTANRIDRWI